MLPTRGNYLGNHVHFHQEMIKGTLWEQAGLEYHMFLLHTRWNQEQVAGILKDEGDVLYVSILRDPVELFRSWWDYLRLDKRYNQTLEEYSKTVANPASLQSNTKSARRPYGYNQMLYDFGMDFEDMKDSDKVQRKVQEIDETFDIMLIADNELFEDSIILLKDALCWEYRDMINFKLNSKRVNMKCSLPPSVRHFLKG